MATLSHKTTLLLSDEEYRLLQDIGRSTHQTMGELIRQAIRKMYNKSSHSKKKKKWESLFKSKAPVSDWKKMESEILKGRLS